MTSSVMIGMAMAAIFLVFALLYSVLFNKEQRFFGEFKSKFSVDPFSRHSYLIYFVERFLTAMILSLFFSLPFVNAAIIVILLAQIVVIAKHKIYRETFHNYRQIMNLSISILIQAIYLLTTMTNDPKGALALYGPFIVLVLAIVSIGYNSVLIIKEIMTTLKDFK